MSRQSTVAIFLAMLLFYLPSLLQLFSSDGQHLGWTLMGFFFGTLYAALFLLNYFLLVPRLLIRNDRKILFFGVNLLLILVLVNIVPVYLEMHGGLHMPRHLRGQSLTFGQFLMRWIMFVIRDSVMMVLAVGLAYAFRIGAERERLHSQKLELDAQRREIELKSLKAQLNPHFLFNSLNNIYALIGFAPDRAQTALHDLSSMLRYMIYDSSSPTVPLAKEMQFIKEYSDLMRLRLGSNVELTCNLEKPSNPELQIAPLLFLTLVENAFKHSGESSAGNFINISIKENGDTIVGTVVNTVPDNAAREMTESGVGLANVEKQLNLLYPDRHSFKTESHNGVYTATLSIRP